MGKPGRAFAKSHRILTGANLGGRRNFVLVAGTEGATKRLQIGVSAASTDDLFAVQSLVRDRLINFLLANYPESVVRTRVQAEGNVGQRANGKRQ